MTKAQIKEKYIEWNKEITKLADERDNIFKELQKLNVEHGDGTQSCSIDLLVIKLSHSGWAFKALQLYTRYCNIEGQKEALRKLALATDNMRI